MDLNTYRQNIIINNNCVYFSNICDALKSHLKESIRIYGCIAWLTEKSVLDIISTISTTIIVQQENWKEPSRKNTFDYYNKLTPIPFSYFQSLNPKLSCSIENYKEVAIRSIGYPNENCRMHHKFLILEKKDKIGVWNGSFNITHNATNSLENAIY